MAIAAYAKPPRSPSSRLRWIDVDRGSQPSELQLRAVDDDQRVRLAPRVADRRGDLGRLVRASASAAAKSPRNTCIELPTVRFSPEHRAVVELLPELASFGEALRRRREVPVRHVRPAEVVQGERDLFALPQLAGDRERRLARLDRARRVPAAVDVRHHDVPEGARLGGAVPDPCAPSRRPLRRAGARAPGRTSGWRSSRGARSSSSPPAPSPRPLAPRASSCISW